MSEPSDPRLTPVLEVQEIDCRDTQDQQRDKQKADDQGLVAERPDVTHIGCSFACIEMNVLDRHEAEFDNFGVFQTEFLHDMRINRYDVIHEPGKPLNDVGRLTASSKFQVGVVVQ